MLFYNNLDQRIFNAHQFISCDELIIISGYVGPSPIRQLSALPINTTVIYGMYGSDSISSRLHNVLLTLHNTPQTEILYSNTPVHSKCYIWRENGNITYALIGSANFSTNGLTIPFRESLAETTNDTFTDLNNYLDQILANSVPCNTVTITTTTQTRPTLTPTATTPTTVPSIGCNMVLYNPRTNEVQPNSALNWGFSGGHTNPGDAYIPIRTDHIRNHPSIFPPKQLRTTVTMRGRAAQRQNDHIELIWDDGTIMDALFEGNQNFNGLMYPKQLSSFPSKNVIGTYIRQRLGLPSTARVTKNDLDNYGRDFVTIFPLHPGTYYIDFSV